MDLDIDNLCRICLQTGENLISIYIKDVSDIQITDKIYQTTKIELKLLSNLPENICEKCLTDLDAAYRFRMNCETSEVILDQYIEAADDVDQSTKIDDDLCEEFLEESEIKESFVIDVVSNDDMEKLTAPVVRKKTYSALTKQELESLKKTKPKPDNSVASLTCDICGTIYKTKAEHSNHVKRHLGEKSFACDLCEMRFVDRSALVRHTRKHTGERPYKCKFCSNRFSDYTTVKRHERTHTGEKPYACKICNKSFALACVLQRHESAVHMNIKNYECKKCGKKFSQSHHLKQHDNVHLKEEGKPYTKYVRNQRAKNLEEQKQTKNHEVIKREFILDDGEEMDIIMSDAEESS